MSLNNIGIIYYKLKNFEKALIYWKETVEVKTKHHDNFDFDLALLNMAQCHAAMEQFDEARRWTNEGLKACGSNCSMMRRKEAEFILALSDYGQGKFRAAENHFLRSYSIAKEIDDLRFQFDNIDYLTQIYIKERDFLKATYYLTEAERIIQSGVSLNLEIMKIYRRFSELYREIEDFKMASNYQQKYMVLKDSVYDEELTKNLMKVEADYLERENKARIAAQEEVLALNDKIIRNQNLANIIAIALIVVLIAFATVLSKQYILKKKDNTRLDQRVRERTHELEINRETLLRALEERDLVMSQINAEVRDALSRFRGLTSLCTTEIADPMAKHYFGEFTKAAEDLFVNVGNYFSREKANIFES